MTGFDATVIVPTRGGAARLPRLFDSLAAQDARGFEVVVVIDGDIDGSAGVIARAAESVPFELRSIVFAENRGRVAALNAGADAARGRILIRCDDDLRLAPHHVRRHVELHDAHEAPCGVIGLCRNVFGESDYAWAYGRESDLAFRRAAYAAPASEQWRYWGANVSVRRDVHERVGGYDARYRRYGWEDVDFGYRLHAAGLPVEIVPELEAEHYGPGNLEQRALRALHSGASRRVFIEIHGPDALGHVGAPAGVWGALVRSAASALDESRIRTLARWLDRRGHVLPHAVAHKAMALLVEGSGFRGNREGVTATDDV